MRFSILVAACAFVLLPFSVTAQQDTMAPSQSAMPSQPAMRECGAEHMAMMADMMGHMQHDMTMMGEMMDHIQAEMTMGGMGGAMSMDQMHSTMSMDQMASMPMHQSPDMMPMGGAMADHMEMMGAVMGQMQNEMEMMSTMSGMMDCSMMPGPM